MPPLRPTLCLGYRIRYVLDLNAREAMHLIELRSGREGHPTYRAVAQAMHERIADVHPAIAAAMIHVDGSREPRLERIMSEIRTHRKRVEAERPPDPTPRPASARSAERPHPGLQARSRFTVARWIAVHRRVAGECRPSARACWCWPDRRGAGVVRRPVGATDPNVAPTDPRLTAPAPPPEPAEDGKPEDGSPEQDRLGVEQVVSEAPPR
jgi:hypothetical protein